MHDAHQKTLLIMRHAKSSWSHPDLRDHDRPLNKRGIRDAPRMGALLAEYNLVPQAIYASTAQRTRMTSEAVANTTGYEGEIAFYDQLYGGVASDYLGVAKMAPDTVQRLMLVGHNPTCEELIEELAECYDLMPTAAIAVIELPIASWADLTPSTKGSMSQLWIPKELDPV